ncbi:hypothetical protein BP6252_09200 [Coleophoma cylindrospora]|uniref:Uncharacterized protein n=1 Tax=Coleophoma cylindrospora TaxID=1849047 RepID=A0A3D8R1U8_9HELO|nr:hypothetical protein BP6252_09200 [Coleophoma cylindrospora]
MLPLRAISRAAQFRSTWHRCHYLVAQNGQQGGRCFIHSGTSGEDVQNKKIPGPVVAKHFPTRQFMLLAKPQHLTKSTILEKLRQHSISHNHLSCRFGQHRQGLVILATPELAPMFDDFKDFVPSIIQNALAAPKDSKPFEVDVVVAIVDGLPPSVDWISTANQRPSWRGLAFLQGDTKHILPKLWDTSDPASENFSEKLASLTFRWRKHRDTLLEFNSVESAIRAAKACREMDIFKNTQVSFVGSWLDKPHSSRWALEMQSKRITSRDHGIPGDPCKRTIELSGWEGSANTMDIAFIVRGAPLQDIRFTNNITKEAALVTFQTSAAAAAFFAYSQENPAGVSHGGTELKVSWGPSSDELLPEIKEAIHEGATRRLNFRDYTRSWKRKYLAKRLRRYGSISAEAYSEDVSSLGMHGLTVTMPLANTLFTNGRYSTLLTSKWKVDGTSVQLLKSMEKKNQVVVVESPSPLSRPIATESSRAIPLTLPRQIMSGLGNIVRQLDFGTEGAGPASKELEANVHSYLAASSKFLDPLVDEKLGVWALVVPKHWAKEFLKSSPTELHFNKETFSGLLWYPTERGTTHAIKRVMPDQPMLPGQPLGYWISKGAILCRVLSGGGGWGLKEGLLALDPQTEYKTESDDEFIFSGKSIKDEQAAALGNVALPGSYIQFFTNSPKRVSANTQSKANTKKIRPWRTPASQYCQGTVLGVVPSTIDNMPQVEEFAGAEEISGDTIRTVRGAFGAVSESGLYIQKAAFDSRLSQVAAGSTKYDMPYTYIYQETTYTPRPKKRGVAIRRTASTAPSTSSAMMKKWAAQG